MSHVDYHAEAGIAPITLNVPPVNCDSHELMLGAPVAARPGLAAMATRAAA